ncbi:hypothetical protein [Halobacillus mangrovi]|uniref:Uncharacterized protein n=1 Tax=Halobacillus mangrovi TaxID=402384 RepID=A0A1W5ZQD9_9BACI|nr:hypothetical protein [Halobacillus mangrovi]ARI75502.1 hypothetical protein HM131_01070 [Halobacillus mangrovi]
MAMFISLIGIAIVIIIAIRNMRSSRDTFLNRTAYLTEKTGAVKCHHCEAIMKRQKHGQHCPNCRCWV